MSFIIRDNTNPFDLLTEKIMNYPKKAKYIQLERALLEDLLREYEQMEEELAELRGED